MRRIALAALAVFALASHSHAQAYTGQFVTFVKSASLASIMDFNTNTLALTPNPTPLGLANYSDGITVSFDPGATLAFGPLTGGFQGADIYHWSFSGNFGFQILDAFNNDLLTGTFTGALLDTSGGTTGTLTVFGGTQFLSGLYWDMTVLDYPQTSSVGFLNMTFTGINHGGIPGADPLTGAFQVGGASGSGGALTEGGSGPKEGDHYDGTPATLTVSIGANGAAAPEPGSVALLTLGMLGGVAMRRRVSA